MRVESRLGGAMAVDKGSLQRIQKYRREFAQCRSATAWHRVPLALLHELPPDTRPPAVRVRRRLSIKLSMSYRLELRLRRPPRLREATGVRLRSLPLMPTGIVEQASSAV